MVPTPLSTLVPTFPRNNLGNVVLGLVRSFGDLYEGISLNTACALLYSRDSFLDLDILCVLVVDDRRMDLICCFLRYGSSLEWFECHERVYFSFSTMDLYNDMEMSSFSI
jgi:hypothetical protein